MANSFMDLIVAIREDDEETYQSIMMDWAKTAFCIDAFGPDFAKSEEDLSDI